jgi:DNA ligase-1
VLLADLVAASRDVAATASRRGKVARLAALLAAVPPEEVPAAVAYLSGEPRQRQTGVGWASLRDVPAPAGAPSLRVGDVDRALEGMEGLSGRGSQGARRDAVVALMGAATAAEQEYLRELLTGGLRQGALGAVVTDAVAAAAGVPPADVRRALMLTGDAGEVALAALTRGADGLAGLRLRVGRPVVPMLAQPAASLEDALDRTGPASLEWKLDGARIQVHRDGDTVAVFTRSLDDITGRVPEVVAAVLALPVRTAVLDGEVIALAPDGRPRPFQVTASRVGVRDPGAALRKEVPLTPVLFDAVHLDGDDLLDAPAAERARALAAAAPPALLVPRIVPAGPDEARAFAAAALARGHEGVMVKSLEAPYAAGRRGGGWLKVKPRHTLDLVVLAAEWGHGRRRGTLSNLHLGAVDADGGGYVMLGKTFKGLTDAMLAWQTAALLALETGREGGVVHVRPALVVEVAFDGVQTSPRYPAGVALRFARVLRHRPDKTADQADTLAAVRAIHAAQPG